MLLACPEIQGQPNGEITTEPDEPLGADVRDEGDGKHLALAKVVAGLLGVSSDDIFRRAERERRRRHHRWIAGLSTVALVLAGLAVWAEFNRRDASGPEGCGGGAAPGGGANFAVAKQGAEFLVFDIAQALRDQEGMRTESVRKILGTAEQVIAKLAAKSPDNLELLRLQIAMLTEFAKTYAAQGDTAKEEEAARQALAIADRLVKADPSNELWQNDLYLSYQRVGDALKAQGKLAEALKAYQESLAVVEHFNRQTDKIGGIGCELAMEDGVLKVVTPFKDQPAAKAGIKSGDIIVAIDKQVVKGLTFEEAGKKIRGPVGVSVTLTIVRNGLKKALDVVIVRDDASWRYDLSASYSRIGDLLAAQNEEAEALKAYQDSFAVMDGLSQDQSL